MRWFPPSQNTALCRRFVPPIHLHLGARAASTRFPWSDSPFPLPGRHVGPRVPDRVPPSPLSICSHCSPHDAPWSCSVFGFGQRSSSIFARSAGSCVSCLSCVSRTFVFVFARERFFAWFLDAVWKATANCVGSSSTNWGWAMCIRSSHFGGF